MRAFVVSGIQKIQLLKTPRIPRSRRRFGPRSDDLLTFRFRPQGGSGCVLEKIAGCAKYLDYFQRYRESGLNHPNLLLTHRAAWYSNTQACRGHGISQ
jgi:hypothetical protein